MSYGDQDREREKEEEGEEIEGESSGWLSISMRRSSLRSRIVWNRTQHWRSSLAIFLTLENATRHLTGVMWNEEIIRLCQTVLIYLLRRTSSTTRNLFMNVIRSDWTRSRQISPLVFFSSIDDRRKNERCAERKKNHSFSLSVSRSSLLASARHAFASRENFRCHSSFTSSRSILLE